jgi:hypothetical protein
VNCLHEAQVQQRRMLRPCTSGMYRRVVYKRSPMFRICCHIFQVAYATDGHRMFIRNISRARLKPDGTQAETRFRLSPKRTSPFKSAGESVQSTAGSRGVCISVNNAAYTTFRGSVRVLATHSFRQFPLHFPSRASPCAIRFQTSYTRVSHYTVPPLKRPQYETSSPWQIKT